MNSKLIAGLFLAGLILSVSAVAAELETEDQKLSYLFGMQIGMSLRQQDEAVDLEVFVEALRDAYAGEPAQLSDEELQRVATDYQARREAEAAVERDQVAAQTAEMAAANKVAGAAFLADNGSKPGVVVTESGLQYQVINATDGPKPVATDRVTVNYRGSLLDGTEFDSSYSRGEPASFALNQVIPGWTEGVQLMSPGSSYRFWIKPELAYGHQGTPGGPIPPSATLTFEVELISIDQ